MAYGTDVNSLPRTLLRIRVLREHRSLAALQAVRQAREAEAAAQALADEAARQLAERRARMAAVERDAARLSAPGITGLCFEQFVMHARSMRLRVRAQHGEVEAARAAVQAASERLAECRRLHAAARRAQDKIDQFRQRVLHAARSVAELSEADAIEELPRPTRGEAAAPTSTSRRAEP